MDTIHVTCSVNDNYLQHCMAMLCSVFDNNQSNTVNVHMLVDNSLSKESRLLLKDLAARYNNDIIYYDVDSNLVNDFDVSRATYNGTLRFPMLVYYRLLLTNYIPQEIKTILYLDCDIIVKGSVEELFHLNLNGYGLAAIKDASPFNSRHRRKMGFGMQHAAFCSGVMVINLDYWRNQNVLGKFKEYFSFDKEYVLLPDQDALNYVFRDKWFMLPYKWGKTPLSIAPVDSLQKEYDIKEYVFDPVILHFSSSIKPWMDVWQPEKVWYIKYLKLSQFPNPTFVKLSYTNKIKAQTAVLRYFIARYIRPLVPDIIEILLRDILNVILFVINIFRPAKMKEFLLKRWHHKYLK